MITCIKADTGYCNGDITRSPYGIVCEYHLWLYERNDKKRHEHSDDDGYGLEITDNAHWQDDMFGGLNDE